MNENNFKKSLNKALGGGIAGGCAMITQVTTLMWLRTSINHQYVTGYNFTKSIKSLYSQGGISRLYRGYPLALTMGPLCRFGDTAMNLGVMEYTKNNDLSLPVKTGISSILAGMWRVCLMPIDIVKTNYQVNGEIEKLKKTIRVNGIRTLYNGSSAVFTTCIISHYPWFFTYNYLNNLIPENKNDSNITLLTKRATCGLGSAIVSDTTSNFTRILKTLKQTSHTDYSYFNIIKSLKKSDGYFWMFRGLKTKLCVNGINSIIFSISWKYFQNNLKL